MIMELRRWRYRIPDTLKHQIKLSTAVALELFNHWHIVDKVIEDRFVKDLSLLLWVSSEFQQLAIDARADWEVIANPLHHHRSIVGPP
jgi:hypothetical protein